MLFSDEGTPTQTIVQSPPRPKQQSSPPPPSKKSPKKIEVYPDYSVDLDELDPELARIAMGDACLDYDNNDRDQKKEESSRQPQKICIKVQYINMESSTNSSAQNLIQMLQKPARFVIMENDTFSILFQHFCKRKCLKQEDLILIHKNVHVLLFTTPASLGMTPDGDNTLEVYTKTGYEEKQKQDKEKMLESIKKAGPMLNEDFFNGCQSESDQAAENEPKIIFTLRDKKGVDISLRARQTTQIKAIIHQYCHVRGFGPEIEAKIRLSFDDETLDPNTMVKDHELEDDDMLSVQM
ncbi:hypothetical protein CLU79DRAFT_776460 [Phycomyces nitens]|nr:hypothetical protein CLU79DRAFT_776460 [Phycomyces nitens]